jgi:hypothetical protein
MSKALRAAFHRLVHRLRPLPVGSRLMIARYRHLRAACSVGKWPRALTARRSRALMDGAEAAGDPVAVLPVLYHLLWRQELAVDLSVPLHPATPVALAAA